MARIGIDKEEVRNWNPRQVVDGVYQISKDNPLHLADYAFALRNGSGSVAEILMYLGPENLRKLQSGKVSRFRQESPERMPLIVVTGDRWVITQSAVERYSRSWSKQGLPVPMAYTPVKK